VGVEGEASSIVQREHFCPSCYRRIDVEIVMPGAPSLIDIEIRNAPRTGSGPS